MAVKPLGGAGEDMNVDDITESAPEQLRDIEFEDRLDVVGVAAGAFLVVVGLATIAGAPWALKSSLLAAGVQVLGALATAGVGVALVWLTQVDH